MALIPTLEIACCSPIVRAVSLDLTPAQWTTRFDREVDHHLVVPVVEQARYVAMLKQVLIYAKLDALGPVVVLIDRSPQVRATFIVMQTDNDG